MGEGGSIRPRVRGARLRAAAVALATLAATALLASSAAAEFPYSRNATPTGFDDLWLNAGQVPSDLGGNTFKFAATPDPANTTNNASPVELGGVRGAHVVDADAAAQTAFRTTTGRPDVTIAILDSGIKWNDAGAMSDLRKKTRISTGEAPKPRNDGLATPNEPGEDCSGSGPYTHAGEWDLNGDGVFNLIDYSCDDRVQADTPKGVGPPGMFEPQDLLIAFSDGVDDDGNGYVDDIVGWDFLDDDNDPFDDVQYGHGTGEARDSTAEADNGGDVGSCPNCMAVYLRVGDSFVADVNRFGAAVTYATDNDVQIVQEALGTLNNSSLARRRSTTPTATASPCMASAADEAAQHNNWPSSLPHVIVANSVTDGDGAVPNESYLAFNGCTNFSAKITVAIPSTSCSSNAVGLAAGFAGLIYSAALNAADAGALDPYPDRSPVPSWSAATHARSRRTRSASSSPRGRVDGTPQADDVDFAGVPAGLGERAVLLADAAAGLHRAPTGPAAICSTRSTANRQVFGAPVPSTSYPARKGFDQFYGYGRANMNRAVKAVVDDPAAPGPAELPPEAEITGPGWFAEIDPMRAAIDVSGHGLRARRSLPLPALRRPGPVPEQRADDRHSPGRLRAARRTAGATARPSTTAPTAASAHDGVLGSIDVAALRQRFPAGTDFSGPIPIRLGRDRQRPAVLRASCLHVQGRRHADDRHGADRRGPAHGLAASRPATCSTASRGRSAPAGRSAAPGRSRPSDGASSPAFADLDGDNRNELVFADSDGFVHAIGPDGAELPGWPVRGDEPGFVAGHDSSPAYSDGVGTDLGGAFLGAVAVGDTDGDGIPEVYAADAEGKLYGWSADGRRVFTEQSNPDWSRASR